MKSIFVTSFSALLAGHALAESMAVLKELKLKEWAEESAAGAFDLDRYEVLQAATACTNGRAGEYQCSNIDMMAFLRHQDMGSSTRTGNDICMLILLRDQHKRTKL